MTRSGVVRVLKIALPLGALALLAALFFGGGRERGEGLGFSGIAIDAERGLRLTNPRFSGRTASGAPFEIRAQWALPDGPDPSVIELGPVEGRLSLDGAPARLLSLNAAGGVIQPKRDLLSLSGGVTARTDDGYTVTVSGVEVDLAAETLRAAGPVAADGPAGTLDAAALEAGRRGGAAHLRFTGGVRLRIDPNTAREEADR